MVGIIVYFDKLVRVQGFNLLFFHLKNETQVKSEQEITRFSPLWGVGGSSPTEMIPDRNPGHTRFFVDLDVCRSKTN